MKLSVRLHSIPIFALLLCCMGILPMHGNAQTYLEAYGQNRLQYRKFDWKFFDTKHFRVYHYDKAGRQLGRYVAEDAENSIAVIEKKLGGQFPKLFNIVLYNSYDEYRQTNIGLKDESQLAGNSKGGTVNLVGDKLVVYFTGDHEDLHHQIRTGMARVVMERMMFGENFKKMVKNSLLLNLPEWVTDGYIAYLVDGWDAKTNSEWKSLLEARPYEGFNELSEQYPELAGKAFWKFVADQYGNSAVKNLLYSMQQKTSLPKAIREKENLDMKIRKAYDSCISYYQTTYLQDAKNQERPDSRKGLIAIKVPKDNSTVRNIKISPRGSDISYVVWKDGMYSVNTQKTAGDQQFATLLEGGMKDLTEQTDPNYPMMAWSTTGNKLAILYMKGFKTILRIYNSEKGRIDNYVILKNRFDRVLSMSFMSDDDQLVFSAIRKSQTDLYLFTIKGTKMTNITDDVWDDLSPVCVSGGSRNGILFLSNRTKPDMNVQLGVNELPTGPLNVYFYNTQTKRTELLQCSDVKTGHVTQPVQYGLDNFAYLYDGNGINNKYVVLFARNKKNKDSAYSVPITNYTTGIINHQYNLASGDVADVVQEKDKYIAYFHELVMPGDSVKAKTLVPSILSVEKQTEKPAPTSDNRVPFHGGKYEEPDDNKTTTPYVKSGTAFQSEFTDTAVAPRKHKNKTAKRSDNNLVKGIADSTGADSTLLTEITDSAYVKMKPGPYRLSFKPDFFTLKLDNSVLFSQYQSIASNGGQFIMPAMDALFTISMNEVMENRKVVAGFQYRLGYSPLSIIGSDYFLQYQNLTHRLDWGVWFLRSQTKQKMIVGYVDQTGRVSAREELFKTIVNLVQADFSYPLDRVRSIKFHTAVKQDKLVEQITDTVNLSSPYPEVSDFTSLSRLEYIFDNTISPALNILYGTRFKFYAEYMAGINKPKRSCYNFGLDIRNYTKLYKKIIVANRLAYAHSDGSYEVEYLLGGVDNWLNSKKSVNAYQNLPDNYGFQAMSTPMRGYAQYARTGNNFLVFNTEVRVPIFSTFLKRPIQSVMLKNLQFVAFMDAGDAWTGFIPDVANNNPSFSFPSRYNPQALNNVFLTLHVPNSGGLALGYGCGLRTSLFGYFLRLDAAWNIEGNKIPLIHLGLGTDF